MPPRFMCQSVCLLAPLTIMLGCSVLRSISSFREGSIAYVRDHSISGLIAKLHRWPNFIVEFQKPIC